MQQKVYNCGGIDFHTPAQKICAGVFSQDDINLLEVTAQVSAPVMVAYITWILLDAENRGIKELYFLARDGLAMYKIGRALAKHWNMGVECKYFYCSRKSLRLPMYCIDKDYYFEKLFEGGDHLSPERILNRAGIKEEEQPDILKSLNELADTRLLGQYKNEFRQNLQQLETFATIIKPKAEDALVNTFGYMKKQGIGQNTFALVDSGWKGTMQESICKILKYGDILKEPMQGYYAGLFNNTKKENGNYYTFLFSPNKNFLRAGYFNCNVFECICPADHGMTLGYENCNGTYEPILDENKENEKNNIKQLDYYERYIKAFTEINKDKPEMSSALKWETMAAKKLKMLFVKPSRQQAEAYADVLFSEDFIAKDSSTRSLVATLSKNEIKKAMFFPRLWQKMVSKKLLSPPLLWAEGSFALSFKNIPIYIKIDRALYRLANLLTTWANKGGA